jgi:hypothetical protein
LKFGSWVRLQSKRIDAYAQALIRRLQADVHQRGCMMEERVLKGDLMYESSMERLRGAEERFVLLACIRRSWSAAFACASRRRRGYCGPGVQHAGK